MAERDLACPFRRDIRRTDKGEIATCALLQKLIFYESRDACDVTRRACISCLDSAPESRGSAAGVFASILANACEKAVQTCKMGSHRFQRVERLKELSEQAVVGQMGALGDQPVVFDMPMQCDVIMRCVGAEESVFHSIESLLSQKDAEITLHIVADHRSVAELMERYGECWNVHVNEVPAECSLPSEVQRLALEVKSEFLALQHPSALSSPRRIADSITELRRSGGDFVGSPMDSTDGKIAAREVGDDYSHAIPWPTLVFRRSAFIDLGGFARRDSDQEIELLYRAHQSQLNVCLLPKPTVRMMQPWTPADLGSPPCYEKRQGTYRHHAIGFRRRRVACDVVLPVYGQLEFATPAIESVIEQDDAESIVHLIDDCGPESVDDLFRHWKGHPRVRLYRNRKNIGQFHSFNNVSRFFETDWVAVQDGDDISLPDRLALSVNLLQNCDADYFAAAMEQFENATDPTDSDLDVGGSGCSGLPTNDLPVRRSRWPHGKHTIYFAMNPTACFRVSMFRQFGGYADFGSRDRNITGLDSEWMIRAYHCGARFSISTSIVTRHRVHADAATKTVETGFGSPARRFALDECRRRARSWKHQRIDARGYGALGRHDELTVRQD